MTSFFFSTFPTDQLIANNFLLAPFYASQVFAWKNKIHFERDLKSEVKIRSLEIGKTEINTGTF